MKKTINAVIAAIAIMASAPAFAPPVDRVPSENDGADQGVLELIEFCENQVGYGADGSSAGPGCECYSQNALTQRDCIEALDVTLEGLRAEARRLAVGILWIASYIQNFLVLLAGGSLLILGANAYFGMFNVQWLSVILMMVVVIAGSTAIVGYIGIDEASAPQAELIDALDRTRETTTDTWGKTREALDIPERGATIR